MSGGGVFGWESAGRGGWSLDGRSCGRNDDGVDSCVIGIGLRRVQVLGFGDWDGVGGGCGIDGGSGGDADGSGVDKVCGGAVDVFDHFFRDGDPDHVAFAQRHSRGKAQEGGNGEDVEGLHDFRG